jgi:hypothetical protein
MIYFNNYRKEVYADTDIFIVLLHLLIKKLQEVVKIVHFFKTVEEKLNVLRETKMITTTTSAVYSHSPTGLEVPKKYVAEKFE